MTLTKRQEDKVKEILKQQAEREKVKQEKEAKKLFISVLKMTPLPIIIGLAAALIYYQNYGWYELKKTALSWTIGVTLIAAMYTTFINKLKSFSS